MQPPLGPRLVSYLDTQLAKSPVRQFGEDNRNQRQAGFESKYGGTLANDSAGKESNLPAISMGRTHLIGERPTVGIDKLSPADQATYFEKNAATKAEGPVVEKIKKGFEALKEKFDAKLDKAKVTRDKFEVAGLQEVGGDGTPQAFKKEDYFKKDKVKKFVDINADKLERINTAVAPNKVENPVGNNVDNLIEGLYGSSFKDDFNQLIDQRIDVSDPAKLAAAPPSSKSTLLFLKGCVELNSAALGTAVTEAQVQDLIKEAVKVSLLQNPEKAQDIMNALAGDPNIQLDSIPGINDIIKEAAVKLAADEFMLVHLDYFSPVAGGVTDVEAKKNREDLVKAIKVGQAGLKLTKAGVEAEIVPAATTLMGTNGSPTFGAIHSQELGPKLPTDIANLNAHKTDLYKGLYTGVTGEMKQVLKACSKAMSSDKAKEIFEAVVAKGIIPATDESLTVMQRLTAFAKIEKSLFDMAVATPSLKPKLEAIQEKLAAYTTPEGIAVGIEKDALNEFVSLLPATVGGASVDQSQLKDDIEVALKSNPADKAIFNRLAMISVGITDKSVREKLHDLLRAAANVEIIREIAVQNTTATTNPEDQNKQFMMALLHKFVIEGNPQDASNDLLNLLYAKTPADKVLSINIDGNPELKTYIQGLLGSGVTVETKLEVNGVGSQGKMYSRAHELFGIIRKGVEAAEWVDLVGKPDDEIKKYLVENLGLKEDSKQLDEALSRFKEVTGATGPLFLKELVSKAVDGNGTAYGRNYTNQLRMLRYYVENGGKLEEIVKDFENLSLTNFVNSIQKDANAKLGSEKGDAMTEQNRVLTVEEQRAAVMQGYEDLSGAKGFKGFLKRMKAALPRIVQAAGFMAIAAVGAAVPVLAGPIALGMAAMRIFSVVRTVKAGIPMIKDMWTRGDSKMAWAMAAGVGANVLINTLVPTPWGMGLGLIGETVGLDLFAMKGMKKEAKYVVESLTNYDNAFSTYFGSLDPVNDKETITKIAKTLNLSPVMSSPTTIDVTGTLAAIVAARKTARDEKNMTLLREYSQVVESLGTMPAEVEKVRNANLKARELHEDTQRTMMAYSLASSATKLGFAMTRGAIAGWNEGQGGIIGGILGSVGIADYRTLFDFDRSNDAGDTNGAETTNITEVQVDQLQAKLEGQLDQFVNAHGLNSADSTILGLVHTADGHTMAMVDTDGDPTTVESFIPLDQNGNLDLSGIVTQTETGGGTETVAGLENIQYEAVAGDSQWTMVENVLEQRYPDASQQEIWTMTANVINEATPQGVYEQLYDHRVAMAGGAVHIGDRLTMQDIAEMAPNQFARAEANLATASATQTENIGGGSVETLEFPTTEPTNIIGAIQFDSPEGPIVGGNIGFLSSYVTTTTDDGGGMSGTTTDDSSQQATNSNKESFNWKEFLFGKPNTNQDSTSQATSQTGGGNTTSEAAQTQNESYETFTLKDPGLGENAQIDESKVEQIIVHGKFETMPDTIIDPSNVDVVEVSKEGVTYIDNNGEKVFVENERGDIQFKFVGVVNPVGLSEGTDNLLDIVQKTTESVASTTGSIADSISNTDKAVEEIGGNVDRIIRGAEELQQDIIQAIENDTRNPIKIYYDNDFSGKNDFFFTPTGQFIDDTGNITGNLYHVDGTNENAFLSMMSINTPEGWQSVPLHQIVKVGDDYIVYIDENTNQQVKLEGSEVLGVGTSYTEGPNGQAQKLDPVQFDFNESGVPVITKVEEPWWNTNSITPNLLP